MSEPNKIRAMADEAAATITALEAELAAAPTRREKKALRQRIAMQKQVESWLRTRAGYE